MLYFFRQYLSIQLRPALEPDRKGSFLAWKLASLTGDSAKHHWLAGFATDAFLASLPRALCCTSCVPSRKRFVLQRAKFGDQKELYLLRGRYTLDGPFSAVSKPIFRRSILVLKYFQLSRVVFVPRSIFSWTCLSKVLLWFFRQHYTFLLIS